MSSSFSASRASPSTRGGQLEDRRPRCGGRRGGGGAAGGERGARRCDGAQAQEPPARPLPLSGKKADIMERITAHAAKAA